MPNFFFETVDGCEILHQLIADRCFFPIVCRVSTILLVLQDHFCCDGGASRLGGALFRRAIVNMTAAKISGTAMEAPPGWEELFSDERL